MQVLQANLELAAKNAQIGNKLHKTSTQMDLGAHESTKNSKFHKSVLEHTKNARSFVQSP